MPNYTYHDGSHVINVLDNIFKLLDDNINELHFETLYFLCLAALFHDVGLIKGRNNHEKNIGDIYNSACGTINGNEKIILIRVVGAHSGKASDGTFDTLRPLGNCPGYSESINTQIVAAMLKFADELAEGKQRTSDYFINNNMYKVDEKIFHIYAQAYNSIISMEEKRLAISYNINISMSHDDKFIVDQDIELRDFLLFVYKRLLKIDDERKYCRFFCHWLEPIKEISVNLNFWHNDNIVEIDLKPILISDKIIPGDSGREITNMIPAYEYINIDTILRKSMGEKDKERTI
jgi:hypothetical protein